MQISSFDAAILSDISPPLPPLTEMGDMVVMALRCARALHQEFNYFHPVPDITLRLHSGIACGT